MRPSHPCEGAERADRSMPLPSDHMQDLIWVYFAKALDMWTVYSITVCDHTAGDPTVLTNLMNATWVKPTKMGPPRVLRRAAP